MADRPSLATDLQSRYQRQRVGSAFDVKEILDHQEPGTVNDAVSINAQQFQSPVGFQIGAGSQGTQLKEAKGTQSAQLSRYMRGFDNRKYRG